ncbi:MAG: rhodanese-like domain-containing protein [Pseudobdellovibrionaceae bacterium]
MKFSLCCRKKSNPAFAAAVLFAVLGCQQKPTVIGSEAQYIVESPALKNEIKNQNRYAKDFVVIDIRDHFEFEKFNVRGSLHFPLDDWFEPKTKKSVQLIDVQKFIQRLSLRGADPTQNVMIVSDDLLRSWAFQKLLKDVGFVSVLNAHIDDFRSNPLSQTQLANKKEWKIIKDRFESADLQVNQAFESALPDVSSYARQQALQMPPPQKIPKFVRIQMMDIEKSELQRVPDVGKSKSRLKQTFLLQLSVKEKLKISKLNCEVNFSEEHLAQSDFYVIETKPMKESYTSALALGRCLESQGYGFVFLKAMPPAFAELHPGK